MYVISTNGILVYKSIEKKEEVFPVSDEQNLILAPNCCDCDARGLLLVDAAISKVYSLFISLEHKDVSDNYVKRYNFRNLVHS
jgi:hypothetical protein